MTRKELLKSKEYWTTDIQIHLFELIKKYLKDNGMTQTQLAEKLGVTKGYITQILNGDFDHKISKFVELCLACNFVPVIHFISSEQYIKDDAQGKKNIYKQDFVPVQYTTNIFIEQSTAAIRHQEPRSFFDFQVTPASPNTSVAPLG